VELSLMGYILMEREMEAVDFSSQKTLIKNSSQGSGRTGSPGEARAFTFWPTEIGSKGNGSRAG